MNTCFLRPNDVAHNNVQKGQASMFCCHLFTHLLNLNPHTLIFFPLQAHIRIQRGKKARKKKKESYPRHNVLLLISSQWLTYFCLRAESNSCTCKDIESEKMGWGSFEVKIFFSFEFKLEISREKKIHPSWQVFQQNRNLFTQTISLGNFIYFVIGLRN